jgi:GR25 family glycosyltransferase involved in LPS biosynthesis
MIDTFVINLDSRPDRWANIKRHFKGADFKFHRISAVVNKVGAYGTFLSFIKAIKLAKKEGLSEVLILEDDCLPKRGFKQRWATIKEWLDANPTKWDIYSGGATHIYMPKLIGESKDIKFYNPMWSTCAHWIYIQSRVYDKLLDHYKQYSFACKYFPLLNADIHNNLFKTVISYPFLAYQESGFSNLSKTRRNREKVFKEAERALHDIGK